MQCRFVWQKQCTSQEVGLILDSAVMRAITISRQRRRRLMAQEAMSELVADITALTVRVMCVVVNNCRLVAARHGYGRKCRIVSWIKEGGIGLNLAQLEQGDIIVGADGGRIDSIDFA